MSSNRSCVFVLGPITGKCFEHMAGETLMKQMIAKSHLFSRLFYSASGWHELLKHQTKSVTSTALHVWRRPTNTTYLHRSKSGLLPISDLDVVREHEVMLPMAMIRLLRTNLPIHRSFGGNSILEAVVFAARSSQTSWIRSVITNVEWRRQVDSRRDQPLLAECLGLQQWIKVLQVWPCFWKMRLNELCEMPRDVDVEHEPG